MQREILVTIEVTNDHHADVIRRVIEKLVHTRTANYHVGAVQIAENDVSFLKERDALNNQITTRLTDANVKQLEKSASEAVKIYLHNEISKFRFRN